MGKLRISVDSENKIVAQVKFKSDGSEAAVHPGLFVTVTVTAR